MQITCPVCHARYALEAALNDDDARLAVADAMKMPSPLGDLALRYIGLFRPKKQALSWKRAAKLIRELVAMIDAGRVEYNGRPWVAPHAHWRHAFEEMLRRRGELTLPLANHNYLIKIIVGQADKAEGQAEQKREEERQHRPLPAGQTTRENRGPRRLLDKAPEDRKAFFREFRDAIKPTRGADDE